MVQSRYIAALSLGALITFGLFLVMQSLVSGERTDVPQAVSAPVIDFLRPPRDENLVLKDRVRPERPQIEDQELPPPTLDLAPVPKPAGQNLDPDTYELSSDLDLGPLALGDAVSDSDILPIFQVAPIYPRSAEARGIGGWVLVEFSVSKSGEVFNERVVRSQPPGTFDRASLAAIRKFKYKAKRVNGEPVEEHGVQFVFTFKAAE